jgi:hypothetical protein
MPVCCVPAHDQYSPVGADGEYRCDERARVLKTCNSHPRERTVMADAIAKTCVRCMLGCVAAVVASGGVYV